MAELTPMMQQYMEIKEQHKDSILFFRLGDFYEMFFDDAKLASKELELTLTGRDCGQEERAPMCGVPYHSCGQLYCQRLIAQGLQSGHLRADGGPGHGQGAGEAGCDPHASRRARCIESNMLEETPEQLPLRHLPGQRRVRASAFCDISTGEMSWPTQIDGEDACCQHCRSSWRGSTPSESAVRRSFQQRDAGGIPEGPRLRAAMLRARAAERTVLARRPRGRCRAPFRLSASLEDWDCAQRRWLLRPWGRCCAYLHETQKNGPEPHHTAGRVRRRRSIWNWTPNARRQPGAVPKRCAPGESGAACCWVLDHTKTAMGKPAASASWLEQPLVNVAQINTRLNAVEELLEKTVRRGTASSERLSGRAATWSA